MSSSAVLAGWGGSALSELQPPLHFPPLTLHPQGLHVTDPGAAQEALCSSSVMALLTHSHGSEPAEGSLYWAGTIQQQGGLPCSQWIFILLFLTVLTSSLSSIIQNPALAESLPCPPAWHIFPLQHVSHARGQGRVSDNRVSIGSRLCNLMQSTLLLQPG